RISFLSPMVVVACPIEKSSLCETTAQLRYIDVAESFAFTDRQFERRAFEMIHQYLEIVGLNMRLLRCTSKEIVGMPHDELIERRRRCPENGTRPLRAPACSTGPLPGRRDCARIARHDCCVE